MNHPTTSNTNADIGATAHVICFDGRGNNGKSLLAGALHEIALHRRQHVLLADADRSNRTLSRTYAEALSPPDASDGTLVAWTAGLLERAIAERATLRIDSGAGDRPALALRAEIARRSNSAEVHQWLPYAGEYPSYRCTIVHVTAGRASDLSSLIMLAEAGVPARQIVLGLNHGLSSGTVRQLAEIMRDRDVERLLQDGMRCLHIPRLEKSVADFLDDTGLRLLDAVRGEPDGQRALSLWHRQDLARWLTQLEAAVAQAGGDL